VRTADSKKKKEKGEFFLGFDLGSLGIGSRA
jgi:hypothetical protein